MATAQGTCMQSPLSTERSKQRSLVTLTPLIDVVFILLVFFMLASNLMDWRAVQVATPSAGTTAPAPEGALRIQLRADGTLGIGDGVMTVEALGPGMASRLAKRPGQPVVIVPQAGVPLQVAIDVLEQLSVAGAKNVTLLRGKEP